MISYAKVILAHLLLMLCMLANAQGINIDEFVQNDCDRGGTGSINITVTGGTSPYTYLWSNGATTEDVNGLGPGIYNVMITDFLSNTASKVFIIQQPTSPLTLIDLSFVTEGCGSSSSFVNYSIIGGVPPYEYRATGALGSFSATTTNTSYRFDGLGSGFLGFFEVTDALNCAVFEQRGVSFIPLTIADSIGGSATCSDDRGSITIRPSNGTPPYTYLWNTGATTSVISGLAPGVYSVTVQDANGCSTHKNVVLNAIDAPCLARITGIVEPDLSALGFPGCATVLPFPLPLYDVLVFAEPVGGTDRYMTYTDRNGNYRFELPNGNYRISLAPRYNTSCPSAGFHLVNAPSPGNYNGYNFKVESENTIDAAVTLECDIEYIDVEMYLYPIPRPYKVIGGTVQNVSTIPGAVSGILNLSIDPRLSIYAFSTTDFFQAFGNTAIWDYNLPNRGEYLNFFIVATVPTSLPLGTVLTSGATLIPASTDNVTSNNGSVCSSIYRSSFDPNDKLVQPEGDITLLDTLLTYTVRFQNTGNDTAYYVAIKDTLDPNLVLETLEIAAYSHTPTNIDLTDGVLLIEFNDIQLPDSNVNVVSSNGFIRYTVKPRVGLPIGTTISNRAAIIFDFNEPVITNTVTNTLVEPSGIAQPGELDAEDVLVFPNPTNGYIQVASKGLRVNLITVADMSGKVMGDSKQPSIDLSYLPKGMYFITVYVENGARISKRVTIQ